MRVALKVAYDGTRFAGSQVQPDARTVHGELSRALRELGHAGPELRWAGRTDAGVSARGNVAAFETHLAPASLLPGLSFRMEDAWAWAWAEVDERFEPRHATRRRYRYHLRTPLDARALGDALRLFEGTHDFSAFARVEPGVEPRRTVLRTSARREGDLVLLDVEGESFLWNQVRRMVAAAERVADGRASRGEVEAALAGGAPADLGTAPPEPLVLLDVEYEGLKFQEAGARTLERLDARVAEAELRLTLLRSIRA